MLSFSVFFVAVFVGLVVITRPHSVFEGIGAGRNPLPKMSFYESAAAGDVGSYIGAVFVGFAGVGFVIGTSTVGTERRRFTFEKTAVWIF